MMINHSTLDCHVTFSTRSLAGPERLFETLTLYNLIPTLTLTQSLITNPITKAYAETLTLIDDVNSWQLGAAQ